MDKGLGFRVYSLGFRGASQVNKTRDLATRFQCFTVVLQGCIGLDRALNMRKQNAFAFHLA